MEMYMRREKLFDNPPPRKRCLLLILGPANSMEENSLPVN